jgi:hypothetical protein
LTACGFVQVEIFADQFEKKRFVAARWNEMP